MPDRVTVTMRVRVPIYVCTICRIEVRAAVHEARSWMGGGGARRPDDDSELNTSGWNQPAGWWLVTLPTLGEMAACARCAEQLAAGVVALVERLQAAAGSG